MDAQALQLILKGNLPINITLSLSDLQDVIRTIVSEERKRLAEKARREHEKPTLSKKDAAQALGVSVSTINRLSKYGELDAIKIGNMVRFKQSDIDNYLENNKKVIR